MTTTTTTDTICITWEDRDRRTGRIGLPLDVPIPCAALLATSTMRRAIAHLAIEIGGRAARRHAYQLVRYLRRLARLAARDGGIIHVSTGNQTDSPATWTPYGHGLGIGLRMVRAHQIVWALSLYSAQPFARGRIWWGLPDDEGPPSASRADIAIRAAHHA